MTKALGPNILQVQEQSMLPRFRTNVNTGENNKQFPAHAMFRHVLFCVFRDQAVSTKDAFKHSTQQRVKRVSVSLGAKKYTQKVPQCSNITVK